MTQSLPTRERPVGVYVIALLMFFIGGVWLLAAIVLPLWSANIAPWYVYLGAAAYFLTLGWGVWGGRRWAYFATLLMCGVLAFYLVRAAVTLQRNVLFPFALLVALFIYMLRGPVRAAFLEAVKR